MIFARKIAECYVMFARKSMIFLITFSPKILLPFFFLGGGGTCTPCPHPVSYAYMVKSGVKSVMNTSQAYNTPACNLFINIHQCSASNVDRFCCSRSGFRFANSRQSSQDTHACVAFFRTVPFTHKSEFTIVTTTSAYYPLDNPIGTEHR